MKEHFGSGEIDLLSFSTTQLFELKSTQLKKGREGEKEGEIGR